MNPFLDAGLGAKAAGKGKAQDHGKDGGPFSWAGKPRYIIAFLARRTTS